MGVFVNLALPRPVPIVSAPQAEILLVGVGDELLGHLCQAFHCFIPLDGFVGMALTCLR